MDSKCGTCKLADKVSLLYGYEHILVRHTEKQSIWGAKILTVEELIDNIIAQFRIIRRNIVRAVNNMNRRTRLCLQEGSILCTCNIFG